MSTDTAFIFGLCGLIVFFVIVIVVTGRKGRREHASVEKERWAAVDAKVASDIAERKMHPEPLSAPKIFWTVFWALWAFSLSAALVVSLVRAIITLATPIDPGTP